MTGKPSRLRRLELAQERKQAGRSRGPDLLMLEVLSWADLLPEDWRQDVEARGARGYADLMEAIWEADRAGHDPADVARQAYRFAFERVRA